MVLDLENSDNKNKDKESKKKTLKRL